MMDSFSSPEDLIFGCTRDFPSPAGQPKQAAQGPEDFGGKMMTCAPVDQPIKTPRSK